MGSIQAERVHLGVHCLNDARGIPLVSRFTPVKRRAEVSGTREKSYSFTPYGFCLLSREHP
jgi:hypothetical protein